MTWTTLSGVLWALDAIITRGYGGHEWLRVMSLRLQMLWKVKVRDDMNDSGSWSQGSRFYENLKAIDDTKDLGHGLSGLNSMNSLGLLMRWRTPIHVFRALNSMNTLKTMDDMCHSRSWAKGYEYLEQLSIVNDMNDLISHELRPWDAMSSLGLWMIWMILCHELRVVDDMC